MAETQSEGLTAIPFELKGSMLTVTVLRLNSTGLGEIARHLAEKIAQAPGLFRNAPVLVDLQALQGAVGLDFAALAELLRSNGMVPVAVRGGSPDQEAAARAAGLGVLPADRRAESSEARPRAASAPQPAAAPAAAAPPRRTRTITQPVRSGQQIYSDGDLILLAAVSPGAEVLADGNIHIYGPLRGRALAGVRGDTSARIFCQSLEAELVSIAGHYRVFDDLEPALRGKAVQVFEDGERLRIEPLS